jgi:hypothetical protein
MGVAEQKLIAFLPWLKLGQDVTIGNVQFIPFRVGNTQESDALRALAAPFMKILSSYGSLFPPISGRNGDQ